MRSRADEVAAAFAAALVPPEELYVWEWADRYRILPQVSSHESGPWRTDRFPFLREVMDELSPSSSRQEVVFMKGSQIGATETALNMILHAVHLSPCPMLYVQKTLDAIGKVSKQRLQPSIDACPDVRERIGEQKSRDASNTQTIKTFPGGILILGGANSAASLRSMPIERLILDEVDSFEGDVQEEGDPLQLAVRRTANFPRRKIFYLSTPKIKETSKIEPLFDAGDQRYYHVPCPYCGGEQVIWWSSIRWDHDDPATVRMECEHCGARIDERHKPWMFANGAWRAKNPGAPVASFHLSALYSPLGFFSWREAATLWLTAQRTYNKDLLKVFVNTVLGETYSETGSGVDGEFLAQGRLAYPAEVPAGALVLTAGVDVQEDRLEVQVDGWGRENRRWAIDYAAFMGDTEQASVWELLDRYLARLWRHESGDLIPLGCTFVDSGYRSETVYRFCATREVRRIFPSKGKSGWGQGLIKRSLKRNASGVYVWTLYTDELKAKVYSHLQVKDPGPGYYAFPNKPCFDERYFAMLTAEKQVKRRYQGRNIIRWELAPGRRNEALDCAVYSQAAFIVLNIDLDSVREDRERPLALADTSRSRRERRVISSGVAL